MTDAKDAEGLTAKATPAVPWIAMAVLVVVLACGALFYGSMMRKGPSEAQVWGDRGDAVGPFAALLNAGALFAAIWAVHLQRREHHDTSQETRRQLAQLERTAKAQENVANAQRIAARIAAFASMNQTMLAMLAVGQGLDEDRRTRIMASIDANGYKLDELSSELSRLRGT